MFRNTPYSSARGALCLFWATGFAVRRQGMRRLRSAQFSGERNQLLHTALRHAHSPRSFLDGKWCVRDVDFGLHGYALSVAVRNTPYSSARGVLCLFWATGFAVRRQGMRRLRSAQFSGERNQLLHTALRHAHSPRSFLDGKWCVRDVDFGLHGYALSVAVLLALMNTRPAVRPHGTRAPSSQRQEQPVASCGAWVRPPSSQPPRWKGPDADSFRLLHDPARKKLLR